MNLMYIDPGTGSMLFAILMGLLGAAGYALRSLKVKLKSSVGRGRAEASAQSDKIPLAIYSDDRRYWQVFAPICRELDRRGVDVVYLTASDDDPVFSCGLEHIMPECIGKGNRSFMRLNFLNAGILLSTTPGLDVYQWKRSKSVDCYIHIAHMPNELVGYRMFGIDYYDELLLSGDFQERDVRDLEEMRSLPAKKITRVGIPYMDDMASRLLNAPTLESDRPTTVLLAPSWGESAILSRFGGEIIDRLLDTGYHIIVRPHPQSFESEKELMDGLMAKYPDSDRLEWNRDSDNFECLRRSDIMISDFSGVIFDFALVYDKPVIYTDTDYDNSPYDSWWLNRPAWTFTVLPRIGECLTADRLDDIKALVDRCLNDNRYADARRDVRAEAWEFPGEGAARVADYLCEKLK